MSNALSKAPITPSLNSIEYSLRVQLKLPLEFKAYWSFLSDDKRRNMLGNV